MFIHLCDDEKFIDAAWKAFNSADAGNHRFIVVGGKNSLAHIRSFSPEIMSMQRATNAGFINSLPLYEGVFLHSLNAANRMIIDRVSQANFIWIGWGFDYYHLTASKADLWQALTKKVMSNLSTNGSRLIGKGSLAKWGRNPYERLHNLIRRRSEKSACGDEISRLNRARGFAPVLETEYTAIRRAHPEFHSEFMSWNYGVHDVIALARPRLGRKKNKIIVGNSATPECNHLDAFAWLEEQGYRGEVLCPLSYGNMQYRSFVIAAGTAAFGARFRPLVDFIDVSQYAEIFADTSHLVMPHLRQQGLTNILLALQSGCRVVMLSDNPLTKFLIGAGFEIDTIENGVVSKAHSHDTVAMHRELLSSRFGSTAHARRTKEFIAHARALNIPDGQPG